jgi:hypothetical protein
MAPDSLDEALNRRVAHVVLASDLSVSGAADLRVKHGLEQIRPTQPVGDAEGL